LIDIIVMGNKNTLEIVQKDSEINVLAFVDNYYQAENVIDFHKPKKALVDELLWCTLENKSLVIDANPLLNLINDFPNIEFIYLGMKSTPFNNGLNKMQTLKSLHNISCFMDIYSNKDIINKFKEG
jgi:hypothetical protein